MKTQVALNVAMNTLRQIAEQKRNTREKVLALGAVRFLETQAPKICSDKRTEVVVVCGPKSGKDA